MTSINTNRVDDGQVLARRLWSFDRRGVPSPDFKVVAPTAVFCVDLQFINPAARRFEQIAKLVPEHLSTDAVLQIFLKSCTDVIQSAGADGRHPNNERGDTPAVMAFLETVVQTLETDAEVEAFTTNPYVRDTGNEHQRNYLHEVTDGTGGDVIMHTADCEFLRSKFGQRIGVVKYRLWIFVMHGNLTIDSSIERTVSTEAFMAVRRQNGSATSGDKQPQSFAKTGKNRRRGEQPVATNERYRLIDSRLEWANAVSLMLAQNPFKEHIDTVSVESIRLDNAANPANPSRLFNPRTSVSWMRDRQAKVADAEQLEIANYCTVTDDGQEVWRFPRHDHVLYVDQKRLLIGEFRKRYLPAYQIACLQASIDMSNSHDSDLLERRYGRVGASTSETPLISDDPDSDIGQFMQQFMQSYAAQRPDPLGDQMQQLVQSAAPSNRMQLTRSVFDGSAAASFGARNVVEHDVITGQNDQNLSGTSDLHALVDEGKNMMRVCRQYQRELKTLVDTKQLTPEQFRCKSRAHLLAARRQLATRYMRVMFDPSANLSREMGLINKWFRDQCDAGRRVLSYPVTFYDPNMSLFANHIIDRMLFYENLAVASWCHIPLLVIAMMAHDAYRHAFDLHHNNFLVGEAQSSKSFVWKQLQRFMIPDTTTMITSISRYADTSDNDKNDVIGIYDELPPTVAGVAKDRNDKNQQTDLLAQMKTRLTEQRTIREVLQVSEETGQRIARLVETEHLGVMNASANLTFDVVERAMLSRYEPWNFRQHYRKDRNPGDLPDSIQESDEMRVPVEEFRRRLHVEQFIVAHVEKMIACNLLSQPTLACHDLFSRILTRSVQYDCNGKLDTRAQHRWMLRVRRMVISNAILYVFNSATSPCFGKPFDPRDLFLLDPFLRDTPEIVYFAFECCFSHYVDYQHQRFLELLKQKYFGDGAEHSGMLADCRELIMFRPNMKSSHVSGFGAHATVASGVRRGPFVRSAGVFRNGESTETDPTQFTAQTDEMREFIKVHGHSYYCVPQDRMTLANEIEVFSKKTDFGMSRNEVLQVIEALRKRAISRHPYRLRDDRTLEPMIDTPQGTVYAAFWTWDQRNFYVHVSLIDDTSKTSAEACIEKCYSKYTVTSRKMLSAVEVNSQYPYLLKSRWPRATDRVHFVDQSSASKRYELAMLENREPTKSASQTYVVDTDAETFSLRKRFKTLFLPLNVALMKAFDFMTLDKELVHVHRQVNKNMVNYPEDIVAIAQASSSAKLRTVDESERDAEYAGITSSQLDFLAEFREREWQTVVVNNPFAKANETQLDQDSTIGRRRARDEISHEQISSVPKRQKAAPNFVPFSITSSAPVVSAVSVNEDDCYDINEFF